MLREPGVHNALTLREGLTRGKCTLCNDLGELAGRIVVFNKSGAPIGITPPSSEISMIGGGILRAPSAFTGGLVERIVVEEHSQGNHQYDPYQED